MTLAIRRCISLAALLLVFGVTPASAQLEDTLEDLTGDVAEGYLDPLANGLSASLNSGIFRSGHVPIAGLTFTLDLRAAIVGFSDEDQTFTPAGLPDGFTTDGVPTVVGSLESGTASGPGGTEILFPGGFDLEHFGIIVPQLTVGSVMGTRAIFRYISLSLGDEEDEFGDFYLFGIGGQHSISQYLPGLPVDVAAGIMYQKFEIGDELVKSSATTFNVTGSKMFGAVVTVEPYVGLSIDRFGMDAEYTSVDDVIGDIKLEFENRTDPRITLGANLNLPGVKLNAEILNAAETGYSVGLSFGI